MTGVLSAERVWVDTFTGLHVLQFARLLKVVRERGGDGTLRGRPWSLPLAERVLVVAVYYRTNLTMRQLGPLFGVSSSTVGRIIQRMGPLLALEPVFHPADAAARLWIVDGTLVPVRDRSVAASSRNYRFSANVQVIVDADTRLVIAAARPVPGTTADAHAWRASGLSEHCQGVTVLGDGAYLNCGMAVPHRNALDGLYSPVRRRTTPSTARSARGWWNTSLVLGSGLSNERLCHVIGGSAAW